MKEVNFIQMKDGTKEDYLLLKTEEKMLLNRFQMNSKIYYNPME